MGPHIFLALLLFRTCLAAYAEDPHLDIADLYNNVSPDEDGQSDLESLFERQTRENADKFLRFGRAFWDYDYGGDVPLDDSKAGVRGRPSRTGSLAGDMQQRNPRDKSGFMRFGRSVASGGGDKKKRDKRATQRAPDALFKRQGNFMRFGRSGSNNFMRFGRNSPSSRDNKRLVEYLRGLLLRRHYRQDYNINDVI